jgi:hypothetical protein
MTHRLSEIRIPTSDTQCLFAATVGGLIAHGIIFEAYVEGAYWVIKFK